MLGSIFIAERKQRADVSNWAPLVKQRGRRRVRTRAVFSGAEGEERVASGAGAARRWRRARQTFQRCFYSCCRKQRESLGAAAARGARRVQGGTKFPGFHAMRSRRVTRRAIRLVQG